VKLVPTFRAEMQVELVLAFITIFKYLVSVYNVGLLCEYNRD